jgi:hypothetical protein
VSTREPPRPTVSGIFRALAASGDDPRAAEVIRLYRDAARDVIRKALNAHGRRWRYEASAEQYAAAAMGLASALVPVLTDYFLDVLQYAVDRAATPEDYERPTRPDMHLCPTCRQPRLRGR